MRWHPSCRHKRARNVWLDPRSSSDDAGGGGRCIKIGSFEPSSRCLRPCGPRNDGQARKKGKRNAEKRDATSAPQWRGSAPAGAPASRRSTAALAQGTVHPQGAVSGHASWDAAGAFDPDGRPNRGAETSRFSTGVTRAGKTKPVPVQRSTSRAGHSAGGMMPKPPGNGSDEPPPAGTALAPASRGHRRASFDGASFDSLRCNRIRDNCQ
jgi:hypothetical protein